MFYPGIAQPRAGVGVEPTSDTEPARDLRAVACTSLVRADRPVHYGRLCGQGYSKEGGHPKMTALCPCRAEPELALPDLS